MQLSATDIDGVDLVRAVREQHLGEASRGGADYEASVAAGIEAEMVERSRQLHSSARYPRVRGGCGQFRVIGDLLRSLLQRHAISTDQAGRDRGLGARAAFEQAPLDQSHIGSLALGHKVD